MFCKKLRFLQTSCLLGIVFLFPRKLLLFLTLSKISFIVFLKYVLKYFEINNKKTVYMKIKFRNCFLL